MAVEAVVVAAVVVIEHLAAGGGPVALLDRFEGQGGALGPQPPGDALGGLRQGEGILGAVDLHQLGHPFLQGPLHRQHRRGLHLAPQAGWNSATSHHHAFGLQPDLVGAGHGRQGGGEAVLVVLGAGLLRQAQAAETAAAVVGQPLQIHHRRPQLLQGEQQVGLAAAGAAPQQPQGPGPLEQLQHPTPVALVAALQQQHRQLQLLGQPGDAGRTHAAAPAVQPQGLPCRAFAPGHQIGRHGLHPRPHQGQPPAYGGLAALLLVQRAHLSPFRIAEQGQIGGSGDVALAKLGRRAHVEQRAAAQQEVFDGEAGRHGADPGKRRCRLAPTRSP